MHGIPVESPDVPEADLRRGAPAGRPHPRAEPRPGTRPEEQRRRLADILRDGRGRRRRTTGTSLALAAYRRFWEPHTFTDPQVRPLWEGLRERGIRVGVLSNTIWTREYHRGIFERDGVLDLLDADLYSSEIAMDEAAPRGVPGDLPTRSASRRDGRCTSATGCSRTCTGRQAGGMRAIWIPHSQIPAAQQVEVDAMPDARGPRAARHARPSSTAGRGRVTDPSTDDRLLLLMLARASAPAGSTRSSAGAG